jgi:hypothetical protein
VIRRVLVERYAAEDQYYGSLVGVRWPEPFQARSPLRYPESIGPQGECQSRHTQDPGGLGGLDLTGSSARDPLVAAAGLAPPAPGCAHLSGAPPTPVGGDGHLCGTRQQRFAAIAPTVKELISIRTVHLRRRTPVFSAQRFKWVDSRGAARRQIAGNE